MHAARIVHPEELPDLVKGSGGTMFKRCELEHALTNPADMVVVDGRPHEGPGNQQGFGRIHPVLIKHGAFGMPDQVPDQALGINRSVRSTGIVGIPKEVVHPVDIEIPVDDPGERMLPLHNGTEINGIHPSLAEQGFVTGVDDRVNIIVTTMKVLLHQGLARMRERAVPDIMEEGGRYDEPAFVIGKLEPAAGHIGKEHGAQRVLEPRVIGTRVYEKGEAQLPDIAEALENRRIEQPECKVLHLDITMDRVLDDLHRFTKESSYTSHKSIE
jgi:hypothetical protein